MFRQAKEHIRYWGFLLVKFAGAALGAWASLAFLNLIRPPQTPFLHSTHVNFTEDLTYTTLLGVWFLFSYGLFYLAVWDQRYRCRTCLRRLRMPVETGSYSHMLRLGRPRIEYICAYGHGSLNVEEIQFPGKVSPEWTERGDIWSELFASKQANDHE